MRSRVSPFPAPRRAIAALLAPALLASAQMGCASGTPLPPSTAATQVNDATPPRESAATSKPEARLTLAEAVPAQPKPAEEPRDEHHSNQTLRTYGWITFAIGANAAVVAVVTSFMLLHQNSVRGSECDAQKVCSQAGLDANDKIGALAGWNAGAWAVAAVGIVGGAVLVIANPPDSKRAGSKQSTTTAGTTYLGVAPNGSGLGLNLQSIF